MKKYTVSYTRTIEADNEQEAIIEFQKQVTVIGFDKNSFDVEVEEEE